VTVLAAVQGTAISVAMDMSGGWVERLANRRFAQ
jgi:hypothetical protein